MDACLLGLIVGGKAPEIRKALGELLQAGIIRFQETWVGGVPITAQSGFLINQVPFTAVNSRENLLGMKHPLSARVEPGYLPHQQAAYGEREGEGQQGQREDLTPELVTHSDGKVVACYRVSAQPRRLKIHYASARPGGRAQTGGQPWVLRYRPSLRIVAAVGNTLTAGSSKYCLRFSR